jgi:biopolymer transport protein ExbD
MKFVRRTTDQEPSVNLTPLIDIGEEMGSGLAS